MFSKQRKQTAQAPRQTRPSMATASTFSVLGADVAVTGDINASEDLHIDGNIKGDITCGALVQGEASEIDGSVTAESARLAGSVKGSISARTLVILKSATITGDVYYDTLTIEQGARVEGKFARRAPSKAEEEPKLQLATTQAV